MNRVLFLVLLTFSCFSFATDSDSKLGYKGKNGQVFGYNTVLEALEALKSDPNAEISESEGWVIVNDNTNKALWSFAPKAHPSYPSIVRRAVVERNGQIGITTEVKCAAKKSVCDSLVKDFMELNQKIKNEINSK
ncbi:molecular chaperone DnaJ [Pseudoalteromonas sp. MM17-2]|uniref:molecular chaperone DnaJ n=1 Tax=Pseudoalteromonas sp. MM17-2 TaxID=2917753 RepID=UPI001EF4E024|nr:molecular chaperone DnaJ [Pseudoalteromonas sp. MM17-2]MCG7545802.1 molecular chaperone DnaJ [Pseudoalteromonas sp. MM17-2]